MRLNNKRLKPLACIFWAGFLLFCVSEKNVTADTYIVTYMDSSTGGNSNSITGNYVKPSIPNYVNSIALSSDGSTVFTTVGQGELANTQGTFNAQNGVYLGNMKFPDAPSAGTTGALVAANKNFLFFENDNVGNSITSCSPAGTITQQYFYNNSGMNGPDKITIWNELILNSYLVPSSVGSKVYVIQPLFTQLTSYENLLLPIEKDINNALNVALQDPAFNDSTITAAEIMGDLVNAGYVDDEGTIQTAFYNPGFSLNDSNISATQEEVIYNSIVQNAANLIKKTYSILQGAITGDTLSFRLTRTLQGPDLPTQEMVTQQAFVDVGFTKSGQASQIISDLVTAGYVLPDSNDPTGSEYVIQPAFFNLGLTYGGSAYLNMAPPLTTVNFSNAQLSSIYGVLNASIDPSSSNLDNKHTTQWVTVSCADFVNYSNSTLISGLAASDGVMTNGTYNPAGLGYIFTDSSSSNIPVGAVYAAVSDQQKIYVFVPLAHPDLPLYQGDKLVNNLMAAGYIDLSTVQYNSNAGTVSIPVASLGSLSINPVTMMLDAQVFAYTNGVNNPSVPGMVEVQLLNPENNCTSNSSGCSVTFPSDYGPQPNGSLVGNCLNGAYPGQNCFTADNWTNQLVPYVITNFASFQGQNIDTPGPVAIAPNGNVYAVDRGFTNNKPAIQVFSYTGPVNNRTLNFDYTFGNPQGIYNGPSAGLIEQPGQELNVTHYIRALAVGPDGSLYLAQDIPGFVLRKYNPNDFTLEWHQEGLDYDNIGAPDPENPENIFSSVNRSQFNFSLNSDGNEPGAEWTWAATTFDNVLYPDDPTFGQTAIGVANDLGNAGATAQSKFLLLGGGTGGTIKRFDLNGFAVPTVVFGYFNSNGTITAPANWPKSQKSNPPVMPMQGLILSSYLNTELSNNGFTDPTGNNNVGQYVFNWLNSNGYFLQSPKTITVNGDLVYEDYLSPSINEAPLENVFTQKSKSRTYEYIYIWKYLQEALSSNQAFLWDDLNGDGTAEAGEYNYFIGPEAIDYGCGDRMNAYTIGSYSKKLQLDNSLDVWFTPGTMSCVNILKLQGREPIYVSGQKTSQYVPLYDYNADSNPTEIPNIHVPASVFQMLPTNTSSGGAYERIDWVNYDSTTDPNNDSLYVIGIGKILPTTGVPESGNQNPSSCNGSRQLGRILTRYDANQNQISATWMTLKQIMAAHPSTLNPSWSIDLTQGDCANQIWSASQAYQRILTPWFVPKAVLDQSGNPTGTYEHGLVYDTDGNLQDTLTSTLAVGNLFSNQDNYVSCNLGFYSNGNDIEYIAILADNDESKAFVYRIKPPAPSTLPFHGLPPGGGHHL